MQKRSLFKQWILFILFFIIGIWAIVTAFILEEGFLPAVFGIGVVQLLVSLLFLKWNIFEGS